MISTTKHDCCGNEVDDGNDGDAMGSLEIQAEVVL